MDSVLILTLLATFSLGILRVLQKLAGINLHPFLAAIFIYTVGLVLVVVAFFISRPEINYLTFKKGILYAILAGLAIVAFDVLALFAFQKGGNVSIVTPMVNGGSILLAVIAGFLLFRESISLAQFLGILAIIGGIFLLTH